MNKYFSLHLNNLPYKRIILNEHATSQDYKKKNIAALLKAFLYHVNCNQYVLDVIGKWGYSDESGEFLSEK
jgi:hypothetical protein